MAGGDLGDDTADRIGELGLCFVNISLITDYDVGLEGSPDITAVTHEAVIEVFNRNNDKLRVLLHELIAALPETPGCGCYKHLLDGRLG
jgi:5'-methylthioadenosine phosphorylase